MASAPWTDEEREFLEGLADRRDWICEAVVRFPDRSEPAIRCMMQRIRCDRGMGDTRFVDGPWMIDAMNGTKRLFEALQRTGLRP